LSFSINFKNVDISYILTPSKNLYLHPDFESTFIDDGTCLKNDILLTDKFIIVILKKSFGTCIKCLILTYDNN